MINDRIGHQDYTYIKNGCSVVDYIVTSHEALSRFSDFRVIKMSPLIDGCNAPDVVPDHSVLLCELSLSGPSVQRAVDDVPRGMTCEYKRYNQNKIHGDFLLSDECRSRLNETISMIENRLSAENDVNAAYDDFLNCMFVELDRVVLYPIINEV